ncbi:MAG: CPBP family glutamic-type intramembrane protease [Candidatus Hodarchaeales archaeon]|jgi:membrane protease YdiL (CAAX protease family)
MLNNLSKNGEEIRKQASYGVFFLPLLIVLVFLFLREILGIIISVLLDSILIEPNQEFFIIMMLNIILILVMLIIIFVLIKNRYLKLNQQIPNKNLGLRTTIIIYLASFALVYIFTIFFALFTLNDLPQSSYEAITLNSENLTLINAFLLFALLVILAPIFEEFIFRRLFIPKLETSFGTIGAVLISSITFGLVHTENDLINGDVSFAIIHFINAFILGLGLAIVYVTTRNIVYPIIFHGFNNFFPPFFTQLVNAFYEIDLQSITQNEFIGTINQQGLIILTILGLILLLETVVGTLIFLYFLFKRTNLLKYILTQIPISIEKPVKIVVGISLSLVLIFLILIVIWPVYLREYIFQELLHLNLTDTIIFNLMTNILILLILLAFLYYFRKTFPLITSTINPLIDLEQFYIKEKHFQSEIGHYNQVIPKFCVYCGKKLFNQAEYCSHCGKKRI